MVVGFPQKKNRRSGMCGGTSGSGGIFYGALCTYTIADGYTDTMQVFELKPVFHMKSPVFLESDKLQIDGYIRTFIT